MRSKIGELGMDMSKWGVDVKKSRTLLKLTLGARD